MHHVLLESSFGLREVSEGCGEMLDNLGKLGLTSHTQSFCFGYLTETKKTIEVEIQPESRHLACLQVATHVME
ncbi:unnamed protein product [Dovyalis caffra]|uniref:Uncharacterized protein n=1 Tax=Dovyalis caffra TaxID=77055 RepID=A0AAV1R8N8_9ROSI|nr:unnamed protein product [Dovyalis caffra]